MKYLFWNTHNNENINGYLEKLVTEYTPDFLGLAEYSSDGKVLEQILKASGLEYSFIPRIGSRVDILYRGAGANVRHCVDAHHFTIKIVPYNSEKLIIAVVHLPSKAYSDDAGNGEILRAVLAGIDAVKNKQRIAKAVIMGDFNMNPFDSPMVEATSLQAVSSRDIVLRKKKRTYQGIARPFWYNPMWNFLGDEKSPVGSFFYKSPANKAMYWNTFDQFVVNDDLAKDVDISSIKFLDNVMTQTLGNTRGIPSVSDHYPLYFEIGESV